MSSAASLRPQAPNDEPTEETSPVRELPGCDDLFWQFGFISVSKFCGLTGFCRSSYYAKAARNEVPRAVPLGAGKVGIPAAEYLDWFRSKILDRDRNRP